MAKQECRSLREACSCFSAAGQWTPPQTPGRRFPIGCVAFDVQITGGEPTLHKPSDLVEIISHFADWPKRLALFTNGIRAKRERLTELLAAGLVDVAFHVDLNQERRGYDTECALNEIRKVYIDCARGLPLNVMFNTSMFAGNFDGIAGLTAFSSAIVTP